MHFRFTNDKMNQTNTINPLPADHDNSRLYSVLLADQTTGIGNEMTV